MKKSIIILLAALSIFSLTTLGFMNWRNVESNVVEATVSTPSVEANYLLKPVYTYSSVELVYNVDSRYVTTVTKDALNKAESIIDILPIEATQPAESFQEVRISILEGVEETDMSETGDNEFLNAAQKKLIQSVDYSTNIYIRADYKVKNDFTGKLEDRYLTYFITVVPEREAVFADGHMALVSYLRENSEDEVGIIEQTKLQPGKVNFTVTKDGSISNIMLSSTSGYPSVDETLVELIRSIPEKWIPATDANGEAVDQEFVFFFGLQGC